MNKRLHFVLPCMLLVTMGSYCETDVIDDPGFQFWCGEELCEWDLEEGEIRKVATWHEHDYAVELVGAPVLLANHADGGLPRCMRVELIADVEPRANLTIEIDYEPDGTSDWTVPVAREGFRSLAWEVYPQGSFPDAVFYVRKLGEGRAIIMQLRASSECEND